MGKIGFRLAVSLVLVALLAEPAQAAIIRCRPPEHGPCRGTDWGDGILGTNGSDRILAGGGRDSIDGDRRGTSGANDRIAGGRGPDEIYDALSITAGGDAVIDRDTVSGGPGNDTIHVNDGPHPAGADRVDCGPGHDTVYFDEGVDVIAANCERRNPA